MSEQITITHERTDDVPVILAFLRQMRVAEVIDKHFPTHGNWTGLSPYSSLIFEVHFQDLEVYFLGTKTSNAVSISLWTTARLTDKRP